MKKLLLSVFILSATVVSAQKIIKIDLQEKNTLKSSQQENIVSPGKFSIKESISSIDLIVKESKQGEFVQLQVEGMQKTYNAGNPDLPVYGKLIEIPNNSKVKLNVLSFDEKEIQLGNYGINTKIIPAQESVSKSDDPEKIPFRLNKEVYSNNNFFKNEFVQFEDYGYLRDKHLGFIQISPFEYNPVSNTLKIRFNFEIEVKFIDDNKSVRIDEKKLISPYFENLPIQTINSVSETKALTGAPVKYVIVSDPMFEETLQPFIEWKKLKGFTVVEAYTNDASVGTTTTSIKTYLQNLYTSPADGIAPTFILLVGDIAQIPAFSMSGHVSDLYYFEYTGDILPDVFYGRFSATTVAQLQPQIDKTLQVEKYLMPDPSYLNNVVLIAGADATYAPTWGNGFVNYASTTYINSTNGLNALAYLYPASASADAQIRTDISNGVSLANYTAHCSSDGWGDPTFSIDNISQMTNANKYPLMIGNCCQSLKFELESFGEEILRTENKGAVGYIGASDYSYWDEDYFWAIGYRTSITANPTYDATNLGSYDRFFHTHDETKSDWYITQGQINVAGNLAVQASTSTRKTYYWEMYHLMGDPSLTPYVKVPTALTASYNSEIVIGSTSYTVSTEENAFVALSFNGTLLDVQLAETSGIVNLSFDAISEVGTADLVITKQNRIPIIEQISVIPSTTPYVVKDVAEINDELGNNNSSIDFNETIKLNVQLKNVSKDYDAFNVEAKLISTDSNIVITDSLEAYETILKDTVSLINNAFQFDVEKDIIDQTQLNFTLEVTGEDCDSNPYTWNSNINLTINAPEIEIGELFIDDSAGDNDGILESGETANLQLVVTNNGHASISGLSATASLLSDGDSYVTLNTSLVNNITINAQGVDTIEFNITTESSVEIGQMIYLEFHINDILYNVYSETGYKEIVIGEIPDILISQQGTVSTNYTYFYDSGGETNSYSDSENYTITFTPVNAGEFIQAEFLSFNVESHSSCDYDKLKIYDGLTTSDVLIGTYCGTTSPGKVAATNINGALTFVFTSDVSVTGTGWKAKINSRKGYTYQLTVNDFEGPIEGASAELNGQIITTGSDGIVLFENIPEGINIPLNVTAEGYADYSKTINLFENSTDTIILEVSKHDITFKLYDKDSETVVNGDITFNGSTLSTINGLTTFPDVEYGSNKPYTVSAIGYELFTDTIDVTGDLTEIALLEPKMFNVTFVVNNSKGLIENALVSFNDEEKYTSASGEAIFNDVRYNNNLLYVIRKEGFENYIDTLDVVSDITENITLTAGIATFQIGFNVSNGTTALSGATIILDNKQGTTNSNGDYTFSEIEVGTDKVFTITMDKYFNYIDTIDIDANKQINVVMNPEVYTITFNVTDSTSHPLGDVKIDFNTLSKYTDSNGIAEFTNIEPKTGLVYTLSKTGYTSVTDTIDVINENITINHILSVVTSVDKIDFSRFMVYPNPSQGIVNIDFGNIRGKAQITVYDVIGISVFNKFVYVTDKNIETIDITNQPEGLYFITIKTDSGEKTSKKILIK